ncbi:receptor-like serine/threonine-protein kinase SD1-8 [Cornus florida]|uniref:receptor-like serine/threonine-protein kinase SD1-8 n=1 Tax=Cornus florida TaxID=4283 RepID=UPI002897428B|nr:receptor-like serine/threonine-protein kinase SD1-8 [Cornus florida]
MGIHFFAIFNYIFAFIFLYLTDISLADDHLSQYQSINGTMTLVSAGKKFRLGFFSPTNSRNQYLGIWFDSIPTQTVVWVANRDNPLNDSSGILKIGNDGNLILQDHTERVVWSTNIIKEDSSSKSSSVAQLLDSGNLVLRHESRDGYIWQSFDHPCDTLLAGMKLGRDSKNGLDRYLTPWKSAGDPSPGEFTYGIDSRGFPQFFIRKGSIKKFRSGLWNGEQFSGVLFNPSVPSFPSSSQIQRRCILSMMWRMNLLLQAYANSDVTGGGSGCLLWYGDLIDIKRVIESSNQKLYIRVTASDLELISNSKKIKTLVLVMIVVSVAIVMLLVASCIIWKKKARRQGMLSESQARDEENMELPIFNMITIAEATNNFSDLNKIGEGGFGPVYKRECSCVSVLDKGQLASGQEIAVKRLSENSKQGLCNDPNPWIRTVTRVKRSSQPADSPWSADCQDRIGRPTRQDRSAETMTKKSALGTFTVQAIGRLKIGVL